MSLGRLVLRTFLCCATAALVSLVAGAAGAHAAETAPAGVLILYSNQRPTPGQVIVEDTLRVVVAEGLKRPVNLYSEYLDDEWVALEAYGQKEADFLQEKYERRNIRVIVAVALPALRFAALYGDRIVAGAPIIHLAVARDRVDRSALPARVLGVLEDNDPAPTLELALRLHPGATRLVLIRGASEFDRRWDTRMRAAAERLGSGVTVEYLSGLPTADVLAMVGALPRGTIVFTPGYFNDGAGAVTTPRQSIERIAAASAVPVYGAFDSQIGAGIVGGYMTRYEDQAKEAGAIVVRLLNGAAPSDIAPSSVKRVPMVDWRQIRRWRIDENLLPTDTIERFREPSAWERYRREIVVVVAVVALQAALIAALLVQRARRRRAEQASSTLAGRLLTAHEDERRRLARDLHDDVTQRLARLAIDAGNMERSTHAGAATALREGLVLLSKDVHDLSYRLHPSVLDDLGLAEGLKAECAQVSRRASIAVTVDVDGVPAKLPRELSLCLFRIAQEALRNVVRHAQASAVTVALSQEERGLQLTVKDDGRGFDSTREDRPPSLGQMSMRERVRQVGGRLRIDSAPGGGTTVTAWVPLERAAT